MARVDDENPEKEKKKPYASLRKLARKMDSAQDRREKKERKK
ncbi:MAG: hypothetical protein NTV88_06260 [Candidatus Micrarchaeota archaeon]|nr:hypothetical protein [Candidatus Micrarchaeota archaeon]